MSTLAVRSLLLLGWLLACTVPARAQPAADVAPTARNPTPNERILAQALFEDGRRLMREGRPAEACAKLEESNRLDPAPGTQFNLADCYEHIGRLASAWILFVDVAAAARKSGEGAREEAARSRAARLEPRLSRLRLRVDAPVEGLVIEVDGKAVPRAQWNTAVPFERGVYRIEARAPGHRKWQERVAVRGEATTVEVTVPLLEVRPDGDAATSEPDAPSGRRVRLTAAVAMATLAGVGVAVGAGTGIAAIAKKSAADQHCPEANRCFQPGLELRDEARRAANVSTISFAVAGGAAAGALLLWLTAGDAAEDESSASKSTPRAWLWTAPGAAGLGVGGRF